MSELQLLLISSASLAFIHTLLGPDHYLPFIVLGRARKWSQTKTLWITFVSGFGHVAGSVIIGITGVAMGISLNKLTAIESFRGEVVGILLLLFGLGYLGYGVYNFLRSKSHLHFPSFLMPKSIRKIHHLPETDAENKTGDSTKLTPWILFLIFVFGPCEVLIPLLIFPAANHNTIGIIGVSVVFGIVTILTMLTVVVLGYHGTSFIQFRKVNKLWHLIAGVILTLLGLGLTFWGW